VGWAWANSLCEHVNVTVVTRANNQGVIDAWYAQHTQKSKPQFIYYDPPIWILWLKKKRFLPVQLFYGLWQMGVSLSLLKKSNDFDLVHHVTFNSMMMPGFWWFSPIPVILGPLGGTSCVREDYWPLFGYKIWKEYLRAMLIRCWVWLPWIRFSFNRATLIFCANSETLRQVSRRYKGKAKLMLETGVDRLPEEPSAKGGGREGKARIIWIGTIEPWKALSIALAGFSKALEDKPLSCELHLDIVGKGSEMELAKHQVEKLGIMKSVTFHGWVPKNEVDQMLMDAEALLFTSVKDTSGNVVLEAMAQGVPVICINHQGVGDITTDKTAIRIEPSSIEHTARGVANALSKIVTQPSYVKKLGQAGYQRVKEKYIWKQRAKKMVAIYTDVKDTL